MIYSGEMQASRATKEKYPSVLVANLCEIFLGGTPKKSISSYWGGEVKWATAKDIANSHSRCIKHTENTITQEGLKNLGAKLLEKDTIVITARGVVGVVLCAASSDAMIDYVNSSSTGTKMPRTSWKDIVKFEIVIPRNKILEYFNDVIIGFTNKILYNIYENNNLSATKEVLLPKLISGEIKVQDG